jgi:hypothetical protein
MSTIEYDLSRMTVQSSGPNPKEPGGGEPEYSREELMACAAEMPHLAWHCLLAKHHQDQLSERELLKRAHMMSILEWFTNPEHRLKPIQAGQLARVAELAVLCYLMPKIPHATSYTHRAAFAGCGHDKFKTTFQSHLDWIIRELEYTERIGVRTYLERKYGPR